MNVLLVHGFLNTGSFFRHLQARLESAGHQCFAPTLHPRDGRHGIADLANKLADYVDEELPPAASFALVGFSMGCVISQCYLQSERGAPRVRAFFAISGPMRGTLTAWLYPGKGTRDMRPGSDFLHELESRADSRFNIPVYTYSTPLDLIIIPFTSSRIVNARELRVWSPLHICMLTNRKVAAHIQEKLCAL
jgi:triacylglycerol lipase